MFSRARFVSISGATAITVALVALVALVAPNSQAAALAYAASTPVAVAAPAAVTAAVAAAGSQYVRSGIAVLDTTTGQIWEAGDAEGQFPAESVVKVLIAARLLADGQMTGATEQLAFTMITQSDDDAADALWGLVGGPDVIAWAEQRYGIADLGAAPITASRWGNTKLTPRGLVELYAAVKADPLVGRWLMSTMGQMTPDGSDGTNQTFGLPSAVSVGAFKQGWGGDDDNFDSEGLNSTGYLDGGRYAVAIFTQHIPWVSMSTLVPVIDTLAAAVAPAGVVAPGGAVGSSAAPASTPSTASSTGASPASSAGTSTPPAVAAASATASSLSAAPVTAGVTASNSTDDGQGRGQTGASAGAARHTRVIDAAEAGGLGGIALLVWAVAVAASRLRRRRTGRGAA